MIEESFLESLSPHVEKSVYSILIYRKILFAHLHEYIEKNSGALIIFDLVNKKD